MADVARHLVAEPLTAEAWAPFGWIPVADVDPSDGTHRLAFAWADPHVNVISHAPDEIARDATGLRCERMFRHDTHTQVLMALNGPSVIAVAPAGADFSSPTDVDAVRAFRLEVFDSLVLHRGTWHWGPFPLGEEPVRLFNVQGLRYAEDNAAVELAAQGIDVVVRGGP